MPIHEAAAFKRGGLTRQQKREAEAAIYGISLATGDSRLNLTAEEIDRMRQLVAQHDQTNAQANRGTIKEFDLNNPPKAPYSYQEYPRVMYRGTAHKLAHNAEQAAEAEAHGWSKTPQTAPAAEAEPALDPEAAAEAQALDRIAKQKKAR